MTALRAPLLAFYSKSFYRGVARNGRGTHLLHPLVLLAVCCLPLTVAAQLRSFGPRAAALAPLARLPRGLPPITLRGGEATVEAQQPCVIPDPATGKPLMILDTTGATTSLKGTEATFLLTKTEVFIRRSPHEVTAVELVAFPFASLSRDVVAGWLWWLKGPLALLFYAVALVLSYLYVLAQAIVGAGVGLLLVRKRRWEFGYQAVMRLATTATMPAVLLATAALLVGARAPLVAWLLVCLVITLGYVCFGIRAATEPRGSDLGATPDVPSFSVD